MAFRACRRRLVAGAAALAAVGGTALAVAPASTAADVSIADRRYIFEINNIQCIDETGSIDSGSDEIFAKIELLDSPLSHDTMYTQILRNVDAGDQDMFDLYTRTISPKRVHMGPNSGRSDTLVGENLDAWSLIRQGTSGNLTVRLSLYEADGGIFDGDNELIGTVTPHFTAQGLALDLTNEQDSHTYPYTFTGAGGQYKAFIVVHRVH